MSVPVWVVRWFQMLAVIYEWWLTTTFKAEKKPALFIEDWLYCETVMFQSSWESQVAFEQEKAVKRRTLYGQMELIVY